MTEDAKATRIFGRTSAEKKETFLAVGRELHESGKVVPSKWRWQLSVAVAEACGYAATQHAYIYSAMNPFGSDGLREIRIACIGEEAEAKFFMGARALKRQAGIGERRAKGLEREKARLALSAEKLQWAQRIREAIAEIRSMRGPMIRSEVARIAARGGKLDVAIKVVDAYTTPELYALGYPRRGEYSAMPLGSNQPSNGQDPDENVQILDSGERIKFYVERHIAVAKLLPPEKRTIKGLAGEMNVAPFKVVGIVASSPELAALLEDGTTVRNANFLSRK